MPVVRVETADQSGDARPAGVGVGARVWCQENLDDPIDCGLASGCVLQEPDCFFGGDRVLVAAPQDGFHPPDDDAVLEMGEMGFERFDVSLELAQQSHRSSGWSSV